MEKKHMDQIIGTTIWCFEQYLRKELGFKPLKVEINLDICGAKKNNNA